MRPGRIRNVTAIVIAVAFLWLAAWYWWPEVATKEAASDVVSMKLESDSVAEKSVIATQSYSGAEPKEVAEGGPEAKAKNCIDPAEVTARNDLPDITQADFANAAALLMDSPDPRHLIAAALLTFDEENQSLRIARFDTALDVNPTDPVVLSLVYIECRRDGFSDWCERQDIESRLIAADTNNAETWALIANRRLRNDDTKGGFDALAKAAAAPITDTYFVEQLDIVERGLAATGTGTYGQRFVAAMGVTAALVRPYGQVIQSCGELSNGSPEWRDACLANGERLVNQSQTLLGYFLGLGLQKTVYSAIGDEKGLEETNAIREELRMRFDDAIDIGFEKRIFYDDAFVAKYSDYFKNNGELAAWEYRRERLEAWRAERCDAGS